MARLLTLTFAALTAVLTFLAWKSGTFTQPSPAPRISSAPAPEKENRRPLYAPDARNPLPVVLPGPAEAAAIVIPNCPITVINKQEVPSQSEGVIRVIGTEVDPSKPFATGEGVSSGRRGNAHAAA